MITPINPDPDQILAPDYTMKIFDPPRFRRVVEIVVPMVEKLKERHPDIGALAACGHSGVFLVGAVAYHTNLPILAVRKTRDSVHDSSMVNGWINCESYLIIDDLIASGRTIDRIIKAVSEGHEQCSSAIDFINDPSGKTRRLRLGFRPVPPRPAACLFFDHSFNGNLRTIWNQQEIRIPCYSTYYDEHLTRNESPHAVMKTDAVYDFEREMAELKAARADIDLKLAV
jgi:adenine/guanine phosphoribosyltransferase-like PRPP-binding protein